MKNNYFVIVANYSGYEGRSPHKDYRVAFVHKVDSHCNLHHIFDSPYYNTEIVHLADSKKEAEALSDFWNECYRKNGTYLYRSESTF